MEDQGSETFLSRNKKILYREFIFHTFHYIAKISYVIINRRQLFGSNQVKPNRKWRKK